MTRDRQAIELFLLRGLPPHVRHVEAQHHRTCPRLAGGDCQCEVRVSADDGVQARYRDRTRTDGAIAIHHGVQPDIVPPAGPVDSAEVAALHRKALSELDGEMARRQGLGQ